MTKVTDNAKRPNKQPKKEYLLNKKAKPTGAILNKSIALSKTRDKLTIQYTNNKASKLLSKHMIFARIYKNIQFEIVECVA